MHKIFYLLLLGITIPAGKIIAQEILPGITVKNYNGKIIVSWKNEYPLEVKTINIQRSFDSGRNFTTIGSVINPQSMENGFVDEKPPYNKMYYRVFISFDAGAYIFSESVRPVKELPFPSPIIATDGSKIPANNTNPFSGVEVTVDKPGVPHDNRSNPNDPKISGRPNNHPENREMITYPSRRIYTGKDNNVVIHLPNIEVRKYLVKFFDDDNKPLFELSKIKDDYLIIEKVNFLRSGWFYFEVYENGKLIEKNKFYIPKDTRIF
jgi:hypothetical protein